MENTTLSYQQRKLLVQELSSWLSRLDGFGLFVTFNFNAEASLQSGRTALRRFHCILDRKLLGKHFNKRPAQERTFFIAFPEHLNSNLHYHALVRTDVPRFIMHAPGIWKRLVPQGELHISTNIQAALTAENQTLITEHDLDYLSNYALKEAWNQINFESFIISSEFLPK